LKCFAKKEYIEPEKRKNGIAEPKKILFGGEHSLPYMFSAAATFHFEMSALNVVLLVNKYAKFRTNDTSQSPIGPYVASIPGLLFVSNQSSTIRFIVLPVLSDEKA
jgi:hypothetical protein